MNWLQKIKSKLADVMYPKHIKCICCGRELNARKSGDICDVCFGTSFLLNHNRCKRCGCAMPDDTTSVCFNCKKSNFTFTQCIACFPYKGKIRSAVYKFKYKHQKSLAQPFAELMAKVYASSDWHIDYVTFVPLHPSREKTRGYNQARELAVHFSEITHIPMLATCTRDRDTPSQTKMNRSERIHNVRGAFAFNPEIAPDIVDKNILILDDVYTTGSTANEISKLLIDHHAHKTYVITVCHGE